ncbi:MAG: hypothetical protein WA047_12035 [Phenylobacterium sp.]|uniref:hypothetical protein n=1 Tax=Phenylobacterium sp. TaxID=1871053 RepID=UPI003BB66A0F
MLVRQGVELVEGHLLADDPAKSFTLFAIGRAKGGRPSAGAWMKSTLNTSSDRSLNRGDPKSSSTSLSSQE